MLQLNFTPFPVLETQRLMLRQLTIADAPEIFIMRNDEELTKYTGGPKAHNMEDAFSFIERIDKNIAGNEGVLWGIILRGEEKIAGSICYWNIAKEEDRAELGYSLLQTCQGQGVMDEALKEVIAYGWEVMKLKTIEAYTHKENQSSRRLLKRNNFTLGKEIEADKPGNEDLKDMLIYSLESR